ncbi:hypothetical protein LCGC14_0442940 [marine sediment metagenome]|uniref:Uncharacterized protein n=1 Tax=marine sediment metagenome TaxID=412755 RepID=A0A0F9SR11_9ZZZZ
MLDTLADTCYHGNGKIDIVSRKRKERDLMSEDVRIKADMIKLATEGLLRFRTEDGFLVHPENLTVENMKEYDMEITDEGKRILDDWIDKNEKLPRE